MDSVLKAIEQADEEQSKKYLAAVIRRREQFLNGGEVLYHEFSREAVERRNEIMERVRKYEEDEE